MAHGDDHDLIRRATAGLTAPPGVASPPPPLAASPSTAASGAVIGVYRVRYDGILRAMKGWPKEAERA